MITGLNEWMLQTSTCGRMRMVAADREGHTAEGHIETGAWGGAHLEEMWSAH